MDIQKFKCFDCEKNNNIISYKSGFDGKYRCQNCWDMMEGIPRRFSCEACNNKETILYYNNLTQGKLICEKCF